MLSLGLGPFVNGRTRPSSAAGRAIVSRQSNPKTIGPLGHKKKARPPVKFTLSVTGRSTAADNWGSFVCVCLSAKEAAAGGLFRFALGLPAGRHHPIRRPPLAAVAPAGQWQAAPPVCETALDAFVDDEASLLTTARWHRISSTKANRQVAWPRQSTRIIDIMEILFLVSFPCFLSFFLSG